MILNTGVCYNAQQKKPQCKALCAPRGRDWFYEDYERSYGILNAIVKSFYCFIRVCLCIYLFISVLSWYNKNNPGRSSNLLNFTSSLVGEKYQQIYVGNYYCFKFAWMMLVFEVVEDWCDDWSYFILDS